MQEGSVEETQERQNNVKIFLLGLCNFTEMNLKKNSVGRKFKGNVEETIMINERKKNPSIVDTKFKITRRS